MKILRKLVLLFSFKFKNITNEKTSAFTLNYFNISH